MYNNTYDDMYTQVSYSSAHANTLSNEKGKENMAILSSNNKTYRHASVLDSLFCNALSSGPPL